jgi:hypothetical protein
MPVEAPLCRLRNANPRLGRRWLAAVGVLSAGAIMLAAREGLPGLATAAAAAFAVAAVAAAALTLRPSPERGEVPGPTGPLPPAAGGRRPSALLLALAYAWGAVAMQGAYLTPLTGLKWQHGWQYALAMALLAAASLAFAHSPGPDGRASGETRSSTRLGLAAMLAAAQALVAAGGLAALALSGKLWSTRADWAANRVFAALAVAVLAATVFDLVVRWRLRPP